MDEISRVIELVKSFDDNQYALLEMKFLFTSEVNCSECFSRFSAVAGNSTELISPRAKGDAFMAGVREIVQLDADVMRSLCHHYRHIASDYDAEPLKWAVRVKA